MRKHEYQMTKQQHFDTQLILPFEQEMRAPFIESQNQSTVVIDQDERSRLTKSSIQNRMFPIEV